jgi:hypothetical protein
MVKTEAFTNNQNDYLIAGQNSFALSCILGNTGVSADSNGRKIIKAGTPLYIGTGKNVYKDRFEVLTVSGDVLAGIARHTVDVTDGNTNDAILTQGYVEFYRLAEDVQTKVEAVEAQLTEIKFVRGAK